MASLAERAQAGTRAGLALAAVAGLATACGGGSELATRDAQFPTLGDVAPGAEAVSGKQFKSALAGQKLTWTDARQKVNFETTLRYGKDGKLSGSWQNPDAGTKGKVNGSWKAQKQGVCLDYGKSGETCYKLYRGDGKVFLVGQGSTVYEQAELPKGVSLAG